MLQRRTRETSRCGARGVQAAVACTAAERLSCVGAGTNGRLASAAAS